MNLTEAELRSEIDAIYTPIEEAREEILRRSNDHDLRKRVEQFFSGDIPLVFQGAPRAVLGRQLLSPNFEALYFAELARKVQLPAVCFGYLHDKLVVKNLDKYFLCKMYFDDGVGKNGGARLSALRVVDFNTSDGKPLSEVVTLSGGNFCDFHLKLSQDMNMGIEFFDASDFLARHGGEGVKYYVHYLALFICHGILFENYPLSGEYAEYTREVFLPNYKKVSEMFGLKPMIVRMVPTEAEDDVHWRHYPGMVYDKIDSVIQNKQ